MKLLQVEREELSEKGYMGWLTMMQNKFLEYLPEEDYELLSGPKENRNWIPIEELVSVDDFQTMLDSFPAYLREYIKASWNILDDKSELGLRPIEDMIIAEEMALEKNEMLGLELVRKVSKNTKITKEERKAIERGYYEEVDRIRDWLKEINHIEDFMRCYRVMQRLDSKYTKLIPDRKFDTRKKLRAFGAEAANRVGRHLQKRERMLRVWGQVGSIKPEREKEVETV